MSAPRSVERGGRVGPAGELALRRVIPSRPWPVHQITMADVLKYGRPAPGVRPDINRWREINAPNLDRGLDKLLVAWDHELPVLVGELWLRVFRTSGEVESLGLASLRVVTNAGVAFLVDAWQNLVELENMKFHGIGTGTNAEAVGDTALQTELTTQYNPNSTRATGSLTENAANIFETVGTNEVDASVAITEHGLLSQAATGGGTLWDRSQFAAVNLGSGDRLESTYRATFTAGG